MDIASSVLVPDWWRVWIRGNQGVVTVETGFNSHLDVSDVRLGQTIQTEKNELATKQEQDAIAAMPRQLRASL